MTVQETIAQRNRLLGASVVRALEARHFVAAYFETGEDAVRAAVERIPAAASVTFGGSMTVQSLGLPARLAEKGCHVYDRHSVPRADLDEFQKAHYFSDWYLASANAISEDGILFNMDGTGNRVASMIYGPRHVLLLVGMNKVVHDSAAAVQRVRTLAAPTNAQRFCRETPCAKTGRCGDCRGTDSICCTLTAMRLCRPAGRTHIYLFGESAGF